MRQLIALPLRRWKILPSSSSSTLSRSSISSSNKMTLFLQQHQHQQKSCVVIRSYHHHQQQQRQYQYQQPFATSPWEHYFGLMAVVASSAILVERSNINNDSSTSSSSSHNLALVQEEAMMLYSSMAATIGTQTRCDDRNTDNSTGMHDESGTEVDPYDNLPEQDEPTSCSICMTYRQGPCRPYWRKVEACTKGNEETKTEQKEGEDIQEDGEAGNKNGHDIDDDENKSNVEDQNNHSTNDDPKCFKYMMPWIDCASRYRNLYTLIEMDTNYTEGIADLEATSLQFCWSPGKEPSIDWSEWKQYLAESDDDEANKYYYRTENSSSTAPLASSSTLPLWKTFNPLSGDPKLVAVESSVPSKMGAGILECAYAVDQDNNVIGFAYGVRPSDVTASLQNEEDAKKDDGGGKVINDEDNEMVALGIRLVPSRTERVTLMAAYTHPSPTANDDKKKGNTAVESHLYKSKPFLLSDIAPSKPPRPEIKTRLYNVRRDD